MQSKKIVLVLTILTFTSILSYAQVKFALGPKIGINVNTLQLKENGKKIQDNLNAQNAGSEIKGNEYNFGGAIGVFFETTFLDKFGVHTELLFSGEGNGIKYTVDNKSFNDGGSDFLYRMKMINIPIVVKYHFKLFNIYTGIQLSKVRKVTVLFGQRQLLGKDDNNPETVDKEQWSSQHKANWTSFVIGASKDIDDVMVDLRMTFASEIGVTPEFYSYKPFTLQLTVGYNLLGLFGKD